ncbi:unnamed protein product [Merluccius merluccius]
MKPVCRRMRFDCMRQLEIKSSTAPFTPLFSSIFLLFVALFLLADRLLYRVTPGGLTFRAPDSSLSGPTPAEDAGAWTQLKARGVAAVSLDKRKRVWRLNGATSADLHNPVWYWGCISEGSPRSGRANCHKVWFSSTLG